MPAPDGGRQKIVFAKRLRLPSRTAGVLQTLCMAAAFAEAGAAVRLYPGVRRGPTWMELHARTREDYALPALDGLRVTPLSGEHKGLYGLFFRERILADYLFGRGVFYARDVKEALFVARLRRRLPLRRPLFFEMHEILFRQRERLGGGDPARTRAMEETLLAEVDGIISISEHLAGEIRDAFRPVAPIMVSPMGYNPRIFTAQPDIDPDTPEITLAYVGSLYEGKGVQHLVEAMRHLPPRYRLKVIGGTPPARMKELRRQAATMPGGDARVLFTGHLPPRAVADELRGCHVFVIPQSSDVEYFSPIKLYEAVGTALPIVLTPLPTLRAALEADVNAVFAAGATPVALAEAVRSVVERPALAHAIQAANRSLAKRLTWEKRAEGILDFMAAVRGRSARPQ